MCILGMRDNFLNFFFMIFSFGIIKFWFVCGFDFKLYLFYFCECGYILFIEFFKYVKFIFFILVNLLL